MNTIHEDGFLQNNQYKETIGQNVTLLPFVNLVESKDNPRTELMVNIKVVNDLKDLFTPTIINEFIQSGAFPSDVRSKAMAIVSRIAGRQRLSGTR